MPGQDHEGKRSVLRGVSPRRMYAVYADPAEDDWPLYAIQVEVAPKGGYLVKLIDDDDVHYIGMDSTGAKPEYISAEHTARACARSSATPTCWTSTAAAMARSNRSSPQRRGSTKPRSIGW
jgi:hypothetical protein